jgi:hypothetical protein
MALMVLSVMQMQLHTMMRIRILQQTEWKCR